MKCSTGHEWEAGEGASTSICPKCGSPAVTATDAAHMEDPEQTLDVAVHFPTKFPDQTETSDVTQTFTPAPTPVMPPPPGGTKGGGSSAGSGQTLAGRLGDNRPSKDAANLAASGMPFSIIRQHARGGLGVVNLAKDIYIKREVALKQILPQHKENGILQRRFLYEAQITGQLEHPSIVPVYCLGQDATTNPYYVMRFVKGRTLDEIIKEHHQAPNPIVFRELLRRYIAVCQAVAYAHSRGVIHRDLKPANVMLGDYGETLVLDWGLAKDIKSGGQDPALWGTEEPKSTKSASASGNTIAGMTLVPKGSSFASGSSKTEPNASELTMQGQIIGTPAYMAPEQAEGKTELHGPTTDIYALGGILYKILTGHSPQAPTASTMGTQGQRKLTFVPSPPPSTIDKTVDPTLERICMHAMATDPASRIPRALEMAHEIQRWLDEHPLSLKKVSGTAKIANTLRTYAIPLILALTLGVIGLVIALIMKK